ncbi:hypothetical protein ACFYST_07560 [Kitasatospora sp. NPDC004614]|uniref:hypothetical protein n=1 Tax=unclassified Kitasatospora TaxID=2633591 RepID=UPI003682D689
MSIDTGNPSGNGTNGNRLPLRWLVIMFGAAIVAGLAGVAAGAAAFVGAEVVAEPQYAAATGIVAGLAAAATTFLKAMRQLNQLLE